MAMQTDQRAQPRLPLSRDRVLRAAITLADTGGIASLTMRRLAQDLGVEAMSLYNHVANKDDILNRIIELVFSEVAVPSGDDDWKPAIRASAISAHGVFMRHPWAAGLMMSARGAQRSRIRWMEAVLGTLQQGGFSADLTHHAYHALDSHIIGFTLWLVSLPAVGEDLKDMAATFVQKTPLDDYPYLLEHIELHLAEPSDPSPDDEGEFAFGLDLILDGIERLRDQDR